MKNLGILKFGGGSVFDAKSVKQSVEIIKNRATVLVVVILSAFGKTTDMLEDLVKACEKNNITRASEIFKKLLDFHMNIARELFPEGHGIFQDIRIIFNGIEGVFNFSKNLQHDLLNDQVTSFGEMLSSKILSQYLKLVGVDNYFVNAFDLIKTDDCFGGANVDEEITFFNIQNLIPEIHEYKIIITQGFISSYEMVSMNSANSRMLFMTTLGREGSDYTAGIFGYALDAEEVTLYKNVPGIMDIDPNIPGGEKAKLLKKLSYERSEQLLHGTAKKVVHEKTIGMLKRKGIPLYIKSFSNPEDHGTLIS